MFQNFAEFVAQHYALSHRDDTEYWKANLNKEWAKDLVNRQPTLTNGINRTIIYRNFDFRFDLTSGVSCISAGMHWAPTDLPTLIKGNANNDMNYWNHHFKLITDNLENKKKQWKNAVKEAPTLYDFLLKNYYKKKLR